MATVVRTNGQLLARACELGAQLERIAADPALQRLSRDAWDKRCVALGDFDSAASLVKLRQRIEANCPVLWREIAARARLDAGTQDRPAPAAAFSEHGDPLAYAERLSIGASVAQASAVAAMLTAELRPQSWWGRLSDFAELDAMRQPKLAELAELDRQLQSTVRLCDLEWRAGRPVLRAGDIELPVEAGTDRMIASELAALARLRPVPVPA